MSNLKKISLQTFYQVLGKASSSITTLVSLSLITRRFGLEATGEYTLALTFLSFFYLAADFGVNAYVLPRLIYSKLQSEWRHLLGFRLILSLVLVAIALVLIATLPYHSNVYLYLVLVGLISISSSSVFVTANAYFQSQLLYNYSVLASALGSLVSLIGIFICISLNLQMEYLIWPSVAGSLTSAVMALWIISKKIQSFVPIFDLKYSRDLIKASWPVTLTLLANTIYFRVDAFLLGAFKDFSQVGIYNLAYQLFQAALVIPTFIMNGYYPLMIQDLSSNKQKFVKDLKKAAIGMLILGLAGTLTTFLIGPWIIEILASNKFYLSSSPLLILSIGFPAFFLSSLLMWVLVVFQRYKLMLFVYIVGLLLNIVLNTLLIPHFSYIGAAWVTVICEYLILIWQIIILFPTLK